MSKQATPANQRHRRLAPLFFTVGTVLLVNLTLCAPAEAIKKRSGLKFSYVKNVATYPAIPGDLTTENSSEEGTKLKDRDELWLNRWGGGRSEFKRLKPAGDEGFNACNLSETLIAYTMFGISAPCPLIDYSNRFYDRRLIRDRIKAGNAPPSAGPKYGGAGYGVDNLKGRPKAIERALRELVAVYRPQELSAPREAIEIEASWSMLSNPHAHRSTRRYLLRRLQGMVGASRDRTRDPRDRPALKISVPDTSHAGNVEINGKVYDLTGSVELDQQLFVDPETLEIRATRTVLRSTTLEEVQPWLEQQGGQAVLREARWSKVRTVKDKKSRQVRVPCKKIGSEQPGFCIKFGTGGAG